MSFKVVQFLKNSQAFDLKELARYGIDLAVKRNTASNHGDKSQDQTRENASQESSHCCEKNLSEIIEFLLEVMQTDPAYISSSDLIRMVESVCFNVVQQSHVHKQGQQRSHNEQLMQSVYRLIAAILLTVSGSEYQGLKSKIQQECLQSLSDYSEEQRLLVTLTTVDHDGDKNVHSSVFSITDTLGILDHLFNTIQSLDTDSDCIHVSDSWLEDCFDLLLDTLESSEAATCSQVSGILLPKLLKSSRDKLPERLRTVWRRLQDVHKTAVGKTSRQTSNVYIVLCGLSEFYIPVGSSSMASQAAAHQLDWSTTLLAEETFWRMVQSGLIHTDPLARKQAFFLMKRSIETTSVSELKIPMIASPSDGASDDDKAAEKNEELSSDFRTCSSDALPLFWWSPEEQIKLLAMWGDFFLMYETLDEVQVHVVTPVMPRMSSLIQAASTVHSGGRPYLHPSWLTVLFTQCFVHQSKTVSQWGLLQYLQLDIATCPMLHQVGKEFLLGGVLPVLNDDTLYTGQTGLQPAIAEAFTQFMQSWVQILGKQQSEVFLRDFLAAVYRQSWSPVSLTFVFDMLINLPECSAWRTTELQLLREMQFTCLSILSISYRSIVQCLMLQAMLRLLDKDGTSLQQFSGQLGLFSTCLHRGSPLWGQVCEWFESNKRTQLFGSSGDMVALLRTEVATLLTFDSSLLSSATADLGDSSEPSRVACLMLLAADSHYTNEESASLRPSHPMGTESFLKVILSPLMSVLTSIGSHIYLPIIKADTALQLLNSIMLYLIHPSTDDGAIDEHTDHVTQEMFILLSSCLEEIFSFIARQLLSSDLAKATDINRVTLYISVLESAGTFMKRRQRYDITMDNVLVNGRTRLMECCKLLAMQSTDNKEKDAILGHFQTFVACRLLLWLLQTTDGSDLLLPWDMVLPLVTVRDDAVINKALPDASSTTNLRKISNLMLHTKWQCISELLQDRSGTGSRQFPGSQPHGVVLAACVRDLALVRGSDGVPIMECAKVLVNKIGQDVTSLCLDLVDAAWSNVQEERRGRAQKFWHLYSAAVELIFHQCFLMAEKGTEIHGSLNKVISNILSLGEAKPRIVTVFVKHLCSQWARQLDKQKDVSVTLRAITNYLSSIMDMCIMGCIVTKDIRLQQDVSVYLMQLPHLQAVRDDIIMGIEQRPGQRRVILLNFLLRIATIRSPECCQLITDFLQGLLKKYLELKTTTSRGYIMNTQIHRRNVRLWQTVLALVPYILKGYADQILEAVLMSVVTEKQSSVWYLMVWAAIQLIQLEPALEEKVWNRVEKLKDISESNICPLLILITHLGMTQPDRQHKLSFYQQAFPVLLPWVLVRTSSVRHLSVLCIKKIWQDCSKEGLDSILESFPALRTCIQFLQDDKSAVQSQSKPDSYFFLFKVHPVQDYTVQTIFHILPALSSLIEEEFLEPEFFEKDSPSLWGRFDEHCPIMHLYNAKDSQLLEQYHRMTQSVQPPSATANPGGSFTQSTSESGDKEFNVQKKVIPWQDTVMPGFEDVMKKTGQEGKGSSRGGSLVLVASLIDKAPNLGGLCRTSQIFGVSTLVLGNLRVTADGIFKKLSVSAEKWLPMIEVPVSDLSAYLQAMRRKGYTLVGVEQTARSQCLTKYQFPERTLLLLGHERTGIPVELIQLLDVCVEIPQQGIIRSLNVHVSGALLVWEYTRQRLLAQMTNE